MCVEMLLQQTYSTIKPHTDPLTWTYPYLPTYVRTRGPLAHPVHTGALGGVGVNVSKVAEVKEGASLVVRPRAMEPMDTPTAPAMEAEIIRSQWLVKPLLGRQK